jgi:hypothetical protein
MDLQALKEAVDQLPADEFQELKQHIDERAQQFQQTQDDVEARIAALEAGFAELREGLSPDELAELVIAMNYEYIEPDDLPENER